MTELTNPRSDRVKAVRALSGRPSRMRHGQFLVEGPQGVREAVRFAADRVRDIYVTEDAMERYPEIFAEAQAARIYVHTASAEVIGTISQDSQGILAVVNFDQQTLANTDLSKVKNVAVLCEVRDPGNAGTIIRAADAAGADLVVLTTASVDLHNPKVVRSTAGSMFHLPVLTGVDVSELGEALKNANVQIFGAAGQGEYDLDDLQDQVGSTATDQSAPKLQDPTAWFFGNEAKGLSELELSLTDFGVRVPLRGRAESLNVATAATVCLYATSRAQR